MERLLAKYLESLLKVPVGDVDVRVMDTPREGLAAEVRVLTLAPLKLAPDRFGSLLVLRVEHLYTTLYEAGKNPEKVVSGSSVILSTVYGPETAEVFRLLAKQFEVRRVE